MSVEKVLIKMILTYCSRMAQKKIGRKDKTNYYSSLIDVDCRVTFVHIWVLMIEKKKAKIISKIKQ